MKHSKLISQALFVIVAVSGCGLIQEKLGPIHPGDMISAGQDMMKAVSLDDQEVIKLCHEVALESDKQNTLADPSSIYSKRLAKVIGPHLNEDGLRLNYKVYMTEEINAFSLADGTIRVNSGLMDILGDKELASVIGHEIGHVKLGHSKIHMQRSYAASAALKTANSSISAGASNTVGGVAGAVGASALANITAEVIKAQFSQSDEMDADEYSLNFLQRHHYDPRSLIMALSKFREYGEESDTGYMAQFVSSHPDTEARIERAEELLRNNKVDGGKVDQNSPEIGQESGETQIASAESDEEGQVRLNAAPTHEKKDSVRPNEIKPASDKLPSGWYIQLAAFPEADAAHDMKDALQERSVEAIVLLAVVDGQEYRRVLVGPYSSKIKAGSDFGRVTEHGIFDGTPFIRRFAD